MKKFLIYKNNGTTLGEKLGSYFSEQKDDTTARWADVWAHPKAVHVELPGGLDEDSVVPKKIELQPEQVILIREPSAEEPEGYYRYIPAVTTWILEVKPELVQVKLAKTKEAQISEAKKRMDDDVYAEMAQVFGTTNPESATAYNETYKLMKEYPAEFVGEELPNEAAVIAYASERLAAILVYAKNRMARIKQFKQEVLQIQNS